METTEEVPMDPAAHYAMDNLQHIHRRLNEATAIDRITLRDGLTLAIDPVSRVSYEAFCLDPTMTREFDNFLRVARDRRRLLDIGALHGTFSLVFTARAGTEAIAVEPSPLALSGLRENCRLNPRHNVRIFAGAAGASEALVRMRHDGIHLIGADLINDRSEPSLVKVMAGDDIVADQRFVPDMIKIDVEGYEQQVLTGLARTLDYFKPDLHVEIHGPWLPMFDGSADGVVRLLKGYDYRIHLMDGHEVDLADVDRLQSAVFHVFCTHRSTPWADRVRGCG
jgi:FkbM family methyltransferase